MTAQTGHAEFTFPKSFRTQNVATNGTKLHVRVGGSGPAVVLLHGYGETGDMWVPLAKDDLARDRTVIVPDLRGMGLSAKPTGGYDKKTQGGDIAGILDVLKIDRAALVTHDIGNMVGYAFAALHPDRVTRLVLIDAPLPGVGPWEEILKNPLVWHFRFGGPDMERLVMGMEAIKCCKTKFGSVSAFCVREEKPAIFRKIGKQLCTNRDHVDDGEIRRKIFEYGSRIGCVSYFSGHYKSHAPPSL